MGQRGDDDRRPEARRHAQQDPGRDRSPGSQTVERGDDDREGRGHGDGVSGHAAGFPPHRMSGPSGSVRGGPTRGAMPALGRPSRVWNSCFVPRLGSMIDTMRGMVTTLNRTADQEGELHGPSTHFSGDDV
jgi:hypothetical protein